MTRRGDEGQASVELALVLPLVITFVLFLVQVGLIVRDQVLVVHAAREAARQAAVDPSRAAIRGSALSSTGLEGRRLQLEIDGRGAPGTRVRVRVRYQAPTDVPLAGVLIGEPKLSAAASMRVET